MAKRKLAARINLLSAREVLNARDREFSDGGGLILRCTDERAAWVFRYTAPSGKRREMGLGACERQNAQAAGESLTRARSFAGKAREMLGSIPPIDPIDERDRAKAVAKEAERQARIAKHSAASTLARVARAYHEKLIEPRKSSKLWHAACRGRLMFPFATALLLQFMPVPLLGRLNLCAGRSLQQDSKPSLTAVVCGLHNVFKERTR